MTVVNDDYVQRRNVKVRDVKMTVLKWQMTEIKVWQIKLTDAIFSVCNKKIFKKKI